MCGGNLEVADNITVCECEYCGTQQTLPKTHDEVIINLFNRANNLRSKCEFDKAQEIYEKIVSSNPEESEAYWGIILCKYGIEYVEDPATFKKSLLATEPSLSPSAQMRTTLLQSNTQTQFRRVFTKRKLKLSIIATDLNLRRRKSAKNYSRSSQLAAS